MVQGCQIFLGTAYKTRRNIPNTNIFHCKTLQNLLTDFWFDFENVHYLLSAGFFLNDLGNKNVQILRYFFSLKSLYNLKNGL
jgi:hypothetical protein